jgi:parvulin-like peptidyl-prolyl isomerase
MKVRFLLVPLALLALMVAGCGGNGKSTTTTSSTGTTATSSASTALPASSGSNKLEPQDIAVVNGIHVTQTQFNDALSEEKASLKSQGQAMPTAGSTQYATLRSNIVDALVQQAEFGLEAKKLGLAVTPAAIDNELTKLKKKYFSGSETKYKKALKQEGFTDSEVRDNLMQQLLTQKLYNAVTKSAKASNQDVVNYYQQNLSTYQQPATRGVREILVGKNKKALADQIYSQLKGGGNFAKLAKKYSQDPGSKNSGGSFTAQQGQDVPEFDSAVFAKATKNGELLPPVNTKQYGWFVIQALTSIKPAKTTSEAKAAPSIRKQLNSTKQQQAMSDWVTKITQNYCSGKTIKYQSGYTPSPDPCTTLTAPNATTT